ncbi:VOC family protein [Maritimibacter dapengensis]|uniref:VOC family protein n=1 Tax=Maritimibacter dapengensis TaxID=2836868 RepID=A0ABS6T0H7_9RHOB|nr:VOC family protein [Maritimibacter dapengensis]MBV7378106.1 VOC family protein [Maritimibacter dapengensis]
MDRGGLPLFSHVTLGVSDFDRAFAFYVPFCDALGLETSMNGKLLGRRWASWRMAGEARPLFAITEPFEGAFVAGNGAMVAFSAPTREAVDRIHAEAIANGGANEGDRWLRPHYHADYYGAYLRDPDGNKLCVVCHAPE